MSSVIAADACPSIRCTVFTFAPDALRIMTKIRDGAGADPLDGLETLWHDAATPTVAQRTDAVVKMYTATDGQGRPLLPAEAAWEELGKSPTEISRLKEMRALEAEDPVLERLTRQLTTTAAPSGNGASGRVG